MARAQQGKQMTHQRELRKQVGQARLPKQRMHGESVYRTPVWPDDTSIRAARLQLCHRPPTHRHQVTQGLCWTCPCKRL